MWVGGGGGPAAADSQGQRGVAPAQQLDLYVDRIPEDLHHGVVGRVVEGIISHVLCQIVESSKNDIYQSSKN